MILQIPCYELVSMINTVSLVYKGLTNSAKESIYRRMRYDDCEMGVVESTIGLECMGSIH